MNVLHELELRAILASELPQSVEVASLEALDLAYQQTRMHMNNFTPAEERDLRGHYLRAKFEQAWRENCGGIPNTTADVKSNSRHSYNHSCVRVGRLYLTASAVPNVTAKPRKADFRTTYAADGQLSLLEEPQVFSQDMGDPIYAILIYGPSSSAFPQFAHIACPDRHNNRYVRMTDLLAKYPTVIDFGQSTREEYQEEPIPDIINSPDEQIQEPEIPGLRPTPRRAGAKE